MVMSREEIAARMREYDQTPAGIKRRRISHWKDAGIISNDWGATYEKFMNTLNCENTECNVLLTIDRYRTATSKCLDHDHSIINEYNIRAVLCHSCNVNNNSTNTSGVPNVYRKNNGFEYRRTFNGKLHYITFKTFQEACDYKILYETTMRV